MRILCVVPARGGSKGVPRKNLRLVGGKPLLVWTLEQALSARPAMDVVVSTVTAITTAKPWSANHWLVRNAPRDARTRWECGPP